MVVSIDISEKSEIWSTRESRKPAAVFATDSIRDIERDCLLIGVEFRGREDGARPVVPAPIPPLQGDRIQFFWNHAIVLVIERLESGVACHHDSDLFLCPWSSHRRGQRRHSHRVSPVLLLSNHAPKRRLQEGCVCSPLSIAVTAELPRLVRLSLSARDAGDEPSRDSIIAFNAETLRSMWFYFSASCAGDLSHLCCLSPWVFHKDRFRDLS